MFNRNEKLSDYVKLYPMVAFLIIINLLVYLAGLVPSIRIEILNYGAAANWLIADGEYWRIITAVFIHGGFLHILSNMFWLYVFGPELEKIAGKLRFFTIYMMSGIIGNVATYFVQGPEYVSVGASGAIFGILGAFLALVYYTRKIFPQLRQMIVPLAVISVIITFLQPNVNATAHIAGLLTGAVFGFINFHPKNIIKWREQRQKRS
ncbi:Rhomboid protease gluP [Kurthia sp. 3B1D]|uniref:Rhomboid protease gluP n=2 Tax=Kurthia TaxID=1649 RepID=A0A433RQT5_9BACL|nr:MULTISPECIES: rhomboid family intramembrane serine protease [unclassified Kurthia]RUS53142.1 Rhomboid protease gluP [Kurthia sp. 3B1D]HIX43279.1 rhomboid family intramembrane serine protease [Candidatus Kurthia intestinigallinarum]